MFATPKHLKEAKARFEAKQKLIGKSKVALSTIKKPISDNTSVKKPIIKGGTAKIVKQIKKK
jgi:hypothetical protein